MRLPRLPVPVKPLRSISNKKLVAIRRRRSTNHESWASFLSREGAPFFVPIGGAPDRVTRVGLLRDRVPQERFRAHRERESGPMWRPALSPIRPSLRGGEPGQ